MSDAPIVQKTYDVYRTLYPVVGKMPKQHKYTLGERLQQTLLVLLECVIAASYATREKKLVFLQQAAVKLDVLRVFLRLAEEVRALPTKNHLQLIEQLDEVGRMLGGWLRSLR